MRFAALSRAVWIALGVSVAACGARSELSTTQCHWRAATEPSNTVHDEFDVGPIAVAQGPSGGVLGLLALSADGARDTVETLGLDARGAARMGPTVLRQFRPTQAQWTFGVAVDGARGAALLWRESLGCEFIALDTSGAAIHSAVLLPADIDRCGGLRATATGFALLATSSASSVGAEEIEVDASGTVGMRTALQTTARGQVHPWWPRVATNDGGFALVVASLPGSPAAIRVDQFDASGAIVVEGSPLGVASIPDEVEVVRTNSGYFLAWPEAAGASGAGFRLETAALDARGRIARGATVVAHTMPSTAAPFPALVWANGAVLMFWFDQPTSADGHVMLMAFDPHGDTRDEPTVLFNVIRGFRLFALPIERGVLLVYGAHEANLGPASVAAVTLECAR